MKPSEFLREYVDKVTEETNPTDTITVDVPLFIRLLEYAREDAKSDLDLHDVAERITKLAASGKTLTMDSYDSICPTEHTMSEDAEYDDEVGMIKNDIHTIVRVMTHLCRELKDNENLPEWVQEKIAQSKGMLVGVMDYMISQHEQGIQPTVREDASGGGTSSGGIATSMGGGDGFGLSPFMKATRKTKKRK